MAKTHAVASILFGILTCIIMVQMLMPAVCRLLSVTMADSILK